MKGKIEWEMFDKPVVITGRVVDSNPSEGFAGVIIDFRVETTEEQLSQLDPSKFDLLSKREILIGYQYTGGRSEKEVRRDDEVEVTLRGRRRTWVIGRVSPWRLICEYKKI